MPHTSVPLNHAARFLLLAWAMVLATPPAAAQSASHPDAVSPIKDNPYLRYQEPWRWDIRSQILLNPGIAYSNPKGGREVKAKNWGERDTTVQPTNLPDFQFIYPVARQGGFYWSPNQEVETQLWINNVVYKPEPKVLQTPDTHAKYVWWQSNVREDRVESIFFMQNSHIVSADTVFDEELAKKIPWPATWPEEAAMFLTPVVDRVATPIDPKGEERITQLVKEWTGGKDPKSIDEVTLAKFLTGKVIEYVRISRNPTQLATAIKPLHNSVYTSGQATFFPQSSWTGFNVSSADLVALSSEGSVLDLSTLLTSVLRTAGVPARTVICYDNRDNVNQDERLVAIVEFAMYDKDRDQILWIPIDPDRLLDNGRRSNVYQQRWDYFGTHDKLHYLAPLAYYFHPPVNYKAYGFPALYGIKTASDFDISFIQNWAIDVMNTPTTAADGKNNNEFRKLKP